LVARQRRSWFIRSYREIVAANDAASKRRQNDMRAKAFLAGVAGLALLVAAPLAAQVPQDIVIGVGGAVTSTDPHFHNLGPNNMMAQHFFDSLIEQDETQKLKPGLAESWKLLDETTWELTLRRGVKFHDGSDFTSADVVASFKRAPNVPNSPSSYRIYTAAISEVIPQGDHKVLMKTKAPYPLIPNEIANIFIISAKQVDAATGDFNSGKAMIGTGPYKFVEYVPGERVVMERNDAYWGEKEPWRRVTKRLITNPATRVAALRSGDVHMIDQVPVSDIASIKALPTLEVVSAPSNRVIYLHMDHQKDVTPFVTDKQGQPLAKNPLKDLRVRQAISKAIDRERMVERILDGQGIPAGQLLPEGFFGTSANLKVERPDIEGARKLLAEAGYPQGFRMTFHGPNDRYISDEKVLQAIGQMVTRIGIEARVEAQPWATFIGRAGRQEFSVFLVGWGAGTGETSSPLRSLLATFDRDRGFGASNRGRYSNPKLDEVVTRALVTMDDGARAKLLAEASEIGVRDLGIIPLHYEVSTWAHRKGIKYLGRSDQYTLAMGLRPN
jgi:peptide/nickel transport system substrate-binding protein